MCGDRGERGGEGGEGGRGGFTFRPNPPNNDGNPEEGLLPPPPPPDSGTRPPNYSEPYRRMAQLGLTGHRTGHQIPSRRAKWPQQRGGKKDRERRRSRHGRAAYAQRTVGEPRDDDGANAQGKAGKEPSVARRVGQQEPVPGQRGLDEVEQKGDPEHLDHCRPKFNDYQTNPPPNHIQHSSPKKLKIAKTPIAKG